MSDVEEAVSRVAAAIGESSRARMLYCLMDGRARTSTELAMAADVSPSTASEHLSRLRKEKLVRLYVQGRHRYYGLESPAIASMLEQLCVVAGEHTRFVPKTPNRLRVARTCYDHLAGSLAVLLHDRLLACGWLTQAPGGYEITPGGIEELRSLNVDVSRAQVLRRRFAYPCLDWSERKPHLAGALGTVFLQNFLRLGWIVQDLDSRAIEITRKGQSQFARRWGIRLGTLSLEDSQSSILARSREQQA